MEAGWRVSGSADEVVDVIVPRGRRLRARGSPGWLRRHHPEARLAAYGPPSAAARFGGMKDNAEIPGLLAAALGVEFPPQVAAA